MKKELIGLAVALCLGSAGSAWAANPAVAAVKPKAPMSKEAYESARDRIEAQAKADQKLCKRTKGDARDLCEAQAGGREKALKARLEAQYKDTPAAIEAAKEETAKANFEVAREKCDALKGDARDKCVDQAKAAREAAVRQARVEKVDSTGGVFGKDTAGKAAARAAKPS